MAGFVLRPYQQGLEQRTREALRTARRVILQSPTGSGKTVLISSMIGKAQERGKSAVFVVHRRELLDQVSKALWTAEVPHGLIAGGATQTRDRVQVATIQTLARRVESMDAPDLLVIDEAHHSVAATYLKVLDAWRTAYVVGLTATPARTDGRGLGDVFESIVLGPRVAWLIEQGYLSRFRTLAPPSQVDTEGVHRRYGDFAKGEIEARVDRPVIVGDAIEHYRSLVRGPCLVYCVSRSHAHHVEEAYRSHGIDAHYCAGDTLPKERKRIVEGFRSGRPPVIVSVDLFGEGLDCPGMAAVQLLRPTQSLGLHLQQVGRVLRPDEGKDVALILDHVGNSLRHGLPDWDREWSLEGVATKPGAGESAPPIRSCPNCFSVYDARLPVCPVCGAAPPLPDRQPEQVDGKLEEIDSEALRLRQQRKYEERRADGLEALTRLAIERGYKPGWAAFRHAARTKQPAGPLVAEERRIRREIGTNQ